MDGVLSMTTLCPAAPGDMETGMANMGCDCFPSLDAWHRITLRIASFRDLSLPVVVYSLIPSPLSYFLFMFQHHFEHSFLCFHHLCAD